MGNSELDLAALEALIFASDGPIGTAALRRAFPRATPAQLGEAVAAINRALGESGRPYEIVEVAAGFQFRTRPEFAEVILAATPERKLRLSRPALETLALVAYRQPLTRAEIEDLRGVDCGAVVKSLLERDLVRIVGRRDAPGRPALYGTSATFLETFGLRGAHGSAGAARDRGDRRGAFGGDLARRRRGRGRARAGGGRRRVGGAGRARDRRASASLARSRPGQVRAPPGVSRWPRIAQCFPTLRAEISSTIAP